MRGRVTALPASGGVPDVVGVPVTEDGATCESIPVTRARVCFYSSLCVANGLINSEQEHGHSEMKILKFCADAEEKM